MVGPARPQTDGIVVLKIHKTLPKTLSWPRRNLADSGVVDRAGPAAVAGGEPTANGTAAAAAPPQSDAIAALLDLDLDAAAPTEQVHLPPRKLRSGCRGPFMQSGYRSTTFTRNETKAQCMGGYPVCGQ